MQGKETNALPKEIQTVEANPEKSAVEEASIATEMFHCETSYSLLCLPLRKNKAL